MDSHNYQPNEDYRLGYEALLHREQAHELGTPCKDVHCPVRVCATHHNLKEAS